MLLLLIGLLKIVGELLGDKLVMDGSNTKILLLLVFAVFAKKLLILHGAENENLS